MNKPSSPRRGSSSRLDAKVNDKYASLRGRAPRIDSEGQFQGVGERVEGIPKDGYRLVKGRLGPRARRAPEFTPAIVDYLLANYDLLGAQTPGWKFSASARHAGYWFRQEFLEKLKRTHHSGKYSWVIPVLREALQWLPSDALARERVSAFIAREAPHVASSDSTRVDDEVNLLRAIGAQPSSDAPRLVYSDWLLERGDPFGSFIQASLKLEEAPFDRSRDRRQLDESDERVAMKWWGPLRAIVPHVSFRRGMVDSLHVWASRLEGVLPQLVARAPVALTHIDGLEKSRWRWLEPVLQLPLGSLRAVHLNGELTSHHVARLAAAPGLEGLRRLELAGPFSEAAALTLVRTKTLAGRLTALALNGVPIDGHHVAHGPVLSDWTLRELTVAQPELTAMSLHVAELSALRGLEKHRRLEELVLEVDTLTTEGLETLVQGPLSGRLVLLDLHAHALKAKRRELDALKRLPAVRFLRVSLVGGPGRPLVRVVPKGAHRQLVYDGDF